VFPRNNVIVTVTVYQCKVFLFLTWCIKISMLLSNATVLYDIATCGIFLNIHCNFSDTVINPYVYIEYTVATDTVCICSVVYQKCAVL